jgi:hypothetical protein
MDVPKNNEPRAEDSNYTTITGCDGCHTVREGTMFHAFNAKGQAVSVLFLCFTCQGASYAPRHK